MTVEVDVTSPTSVEVDLTEGVTIGALQAERNARIAGDTATLASAATDATTKANAAQAAANAHADSGDTTEAAARTNADALLIPLTQKAAAGGVATLDGSGTIPDGQIPASIARDAEVASSVSTAVAALVASAPSTLDTLNELATALGDDPNFATTIAAQIGAETTNRTNADATILATATGRAAAFALVFGG